MKCTCWINSFRVKWFSQLWASWSGISSSVFPVCLCVCECEWAATMWSHTFNTQHRLKSPWVEEYLLIFAAEWKSSIYHIVMLHNKTLRNLYVVLNSLRYLLFWYRKQSNWEFTVKWNTSICCSSFHPWTPELLLSGSYRITTLFNVVLLGCTMQMLLSSVV